MTATDEQVMDSGYPHTLRPELHKALDAAGIDYWVKQGLTFWNCPDGRECVAYGYQANGKPRMAVKIVGITDPEQAIAATLGAGTCHEAMIDRFFRGCGECGYIWEYMYGIGKCVRPNFCTNCGAKVVEPTTNDVNAEVDDG